jgi:hypothetical protein
MGGEAGVIEGEMRQVRFKGRMLLALRILLTVIAWAALITYAHHLGHKYIGEIREILGSAVSQLGAQVVLLGTLVYLIMLSLPVLPNPRDAVYPFSFFGRSCWFSDISYHIKGFTNCKTS